MEKTPIYTTIVNKSGHTVRIHWTGRGDLTLLPGADINIPYEPWSCCNRHHRASMLAVTANHSVEMTLNILQEDGTFLKVPYNPSLVNMLRQGEPTSTTPRKYFNVQEERKRREELEAKEESSRRSFNITAGSKETSSLTSAMGFTAAPVEPPKPTDNAPAPKEEPKEEPVVEKDITEKLNDIRDKFADLVENKMWSEALDLLVGLFGQDKITFTSRTIMMIKDLDTIVAKYKLI